MIIAIDPGKSKCGIALLSDEGKLIDKRIVETTVLVLQCQTWLDTHEVRAIALGNGTNSRTLRASLEEGWKNGDPAPIHMIDEKHTTEMGIQRYWRYHSPRGWRKWVPLSLLKPSEPVDDYVAWIIGEKFLGNDTPEILPYLQSRKEIE